MGTARVEKVLIATHVADRDSLLRRLQEEGILHITSYPREHDIKLRTPEISEGEESKLKETLVELNAAIGFLASYAGKRKGGMFASKPTLPGDEFRRRVEEMNLPGMLAEVTRLSEVSSRLDSEQRKLKTELENLTPWRNLKHPPSDYCMLTRSDARFVFISSADEEKNLRHALRSLIADIEIVSREAETAFAVIVFPGNQFDKIEDTLKATGVKMIQLSSFTKTPREEIKTRETRLAVIEKERKELTVKASEIAGELSGLETALDLYENEGLMREKQQQMLTTDRAVFIEGWVRSVDRKNLEKIVGEFPASEVQSAKPRKGEKVPVALVNTGAVKPFEMIMNMYGTPDGSEADPTPFMAPFFALFFALCLTDAGYGLVITLVTAYLIWIRKSQSNLLGILFYGGVLSIITGAATGSWFGNMPQFLQIPWLTRFRDVLTLFDPLENPMPFFYLSLGVGYFQMIFGIGISVVDGLRTKRYGRALFESLPWLMIFITAPLMISTSKSIGLLPSWLFLPFLMVILVSLGVTIVLSQRPGPTSVTSAILLWAVVTAALMAGAKGFGMLNLPGILVKAILYGTTGVLWLYTVFKGFTDRTLKPLGIVIGVLALTSIVLTLLGILHGNIYLFLVFLLNLAFALSVLKGWGGRIIWGTYNVYSNTTGVLGIVLSYVRLMALGMVTAGVAAAFNQIAWMFTGIPVLSIVLILVVLIIGHVYNLVMSALSGFVHTLRLQYVEYLPQFFIGGGTPFEPFELKTRYVKVTRRH